MAKNKRKKHACLLSYHRQAPSFNCMWTNGAFVPSQLHQSPFKENKIPSVVQTHIVYAVCTGGGVQNDP